MTSRMRRYAACSALLVLATVACSGDKDGTRSFESPGATASDAASPDASTSAATSPDTSETNSPSAASTASPSLNAGPTATPLRSAGSDPALTAGPSALPPQRAYVPPSAGDYTYAQTGNNRVGGCAVDNRPPPPTAKLQVSEVQGARQEAIRGDAEQGTQATVVEYRADGIYLVSLIINQPGLGRIEFRPAKAVLLLPEPAAQGQEWRFSLRSTDGNYTADATNKVTGLRQPVRLGDGTSISTTTVRTVTQLKGSSPIGAVDLTITAVSSAASSPALVVKEVADTTGSVGVCTFEGHVEALLRSVRPA